MMLKDKGVFISKRLSAVLKAVKLNLSKGKYKYCHHFSLMKYNHNILTFIKSYDNCIWVRYVNKTK